MCWCTYVEGKGHTCRVESEVMGQVTLTGLDQFGHDFNISSVTCYSHCLADGLSQGPDPCFETTEDLLDTARETGLCWLRLVPSSGLPLISAFPTLVSHCVHSCHCPPTSGPALMSWAAVIWGGRNDSLFLQSSGEQVLEFYVSQSVWKAYGVLGSS